MRVWIIFVLFVSVANQSYAQSIAYPIVTIQCDDQNDVLKIGNEIKWDEAGRQFGFSAEQGTYNPWAWVSIDASKTITARDQLELECRLSNNVYRLIMKPKIFNQNYEGKCGNRLSASVSVFRGGSLIIDNQPLEAFCLGNAPVIRGIKVFGKSGSVKYFKIPKHKFL